MTGVTAAASILVMAGANPLIPTAFQVTVTVVSLLHIGLLIGLAIWLLMMRSLTPLERLTGLLIGILLPILGPVLVWIVLGRTARRDPHSL
ncbi:hypothetical protein M3D92_06035 [Micrococcus terreus]|uniref:hypothetical protein n=1 Tax=Micrococcus terreus TaxID=574650 RepID=UPI0021A5435F|nr:hypothetical protein [Micrococcus terreus]MCT2088852.1 hypothetical protein [Micrococcus terreus]MDK7700243.1 hypothetical protein [Micrococcus terreus]WOO98435.1 hypothetical protein R3I42_04665 [Micrococcus terreus]